MDRVIVVLFALFALALGLAPWEMGGMKPGHGHGHGGVMKMGKSKGYHSGHNYQAVNNYQPIGWPPSGKTALLQKLFPVFQIPKFHKNDHYGWHPEGPLYHSSNSGWKKPWKSATQFFEDPKVSMWQNGSPHSVQLKQDSYTSFW